MLLNRQQRPRKVAWSRLENFRAHGNFNCAFKHQIHIPSALTGVMQVATDMCPRVAPEDTLAPGNYTVRWSLHVNFVQRDELDQK